MQPFRPISSYAAIIWDCDGVLIDSETIACGVEVEILREAGIDVTLEDFIQRFIGKTSTQILSELGFKGEFPYPEAKRRKWTAFKDKLKATPGIQDVLKTSLPMAVASGSSLERLDYTLGLTGLLDYFKGHIYSSTTIKNGKPAPDIFLLAAEKLGIKPVDCLVIEDSPFGLRGAKAAGMSAYAFTGGSHMTAAIRENLLAEKPDYIFDDMTQLITTKAAA